VILIPDLETVVILTPRTGTRAVIRAIRQTYPDAIQLYRHMEADGVPQGYDRWRKIGVVRQPIERLWSLYKYLQHFGLAYCNEHNHVYTARQRASVARPFEDWLMHNEVPFTTPYDSEGRGRFYAAYCCRHPMPENRKSQFVYLRPDLGTEIYRYDRVAEFHAALEISTDRINASREEPPPPLSSEAQGYVGRWFAWDLSAT